MKQAMKTASALILTLSLLLSMSLSASAAVTDDELSTAVTGSAKYMLDTVESPQVGSIGGEWAVIGLARSGYPVPQAYWDGYYATVEEYVEACGGVLHDKKYTEYSRLVVALTAIGADPRDVAGYNLLTPLGDFDKTIWQGINGPIWALIALDSGNYDMPVNTEAETQATRQMYVDEILSRQLDNGGWNLTDRGGSGSADPDITGMALQALAKYQDQAEVRAATEDALYCLSAMQDTDGGFSSWDSANSESVVQVIVALCELGIDLDDSRFVKDGNTLLDNLMSYRKANGSFLHTAAGSGSNQMASEQGLYGLVAAQRAAEGRSSLYRMTDVTISVSGNTGYDIGLPGKSPDVQKVPVTTPGVTFDDISAHVNQTAIEALAARGILNGSDGGRFDPDANMTRAQFAAVIVRALGLSPKASGTFTDVTEDKWYAASVGTASAYGIINGVGGGRFNPEGTITRQEAAVMVARAAKLCGMDTELENYEILNTLAQFSDYITIDEWAREGVAFCYGENILAQSDLNVEPHRAIKRCEVSQMIFNLLGESNLL